MTNLQINLQTTRQKDNQTNVSVYRQVQRWLDKEIDNNNRHSDEQTDIM